jgi:hypothetical protein
MSTGRPGAPAVLDVCEVDAFEGEPIAAPLRSRATGRAASVAVAATGTADPTVAVESGARGMSGTLGSGTAGDDNVGTIVTTSPTRGTAGAGREGSPGPAGGAGSAPAGAADMNIPTAATPQSMRTRLAFTLATSLSALRVYVRALCVSARGVFPVRRGSVCEKGRDIFHFSQVADNPTVRL